MEKTLITAEPKISKDVSGEKYLFTLGENFTPSEIILNFDEITSETWVLNDQPQNKSAGK